jgi:hypothetical protein
MFFGMQAKLERQMIKSIHTSAININDDRRVYQVKLFLNIITITRRPYPLKYLSNS